MDYKGNPALLAYKFQKDAGLDPNPELAIEQALHCEEPTEEAARFWQPPTELKYVGGFKDGRYRITLEDHKPDE